MAPVTRAALRGRWMEAAARCLFSPESFALLVEPAIADLQIEGDARFAERLDAYRTVWIGMAAACDEGIARRTRTFVRDNDIVTIAGLALLHAAHSAWMIVLLLGLDGRVHLGRLLHRAVASPTPGVLAAASVAALCLARVLATRWLGRRGAVHTTISGRLIE
jgi:hypothetical protein